MKLPPIRSAVVLSVDGLSANQLGAYGHTGVVTDNLNRLAAESLLFDQAIIRSTQPELFFQRLAGDRQAAGPPIESTWISDDQALSEVATHAGFDRVQPVHIDSATRLANTDADTELAQFFAQAIRRVQDLPPASLTWLHCRGLRGAWDAPYPRRAELAIAEDPDPPTWFVPPPRTFHADQDDPDLLLGYQQAYSAQIGLLDDFIGLLLGELDPSTMFCLISPRGYALGEHGVIGDLGPPDGHLATGYRLHNEFVHVPLMVRFSDEPEWKRFRMVRSNSLVAPEVVLPWLTSYLQGDDESLANALTPYVDRLPPASREVALIREEGWAALQTHAWKLILDLKTGASQLFAKPDDLWEVNDVGRRCPQIVSALTELVNEWITDGLPEEPPALTTELPELLAQRFE